MLSARCRPRDAGRGRDARLPGDPPEIAARRPRMSTEAAKDLYKHRAATAECINARARDRGPVRSLARVKTVVLWQALAHNMARSGSLAAA